MGNFLFGAVNSTKNATDFDKYKYFGFDARGRFWLSDGGEFDKNVIVFDANMSSSLHIDNREKRHLNSC